MFKLSADFFDKDNINKELKVLTNYASNQLTFFRKNWKFEQDIYSYKSLITKGYKISLMYINDAHFRGQNIPF